MNAPRILSDVAKLLREIKIIVKIKSFGAILNTNNRIFDKSAGFHMGTIVSSKALKESLNVQ